MFEYEFRSGKFWEHVIGARKSRRLTQAKVGKELGVGGSTVSQWEKRMPQLAAHRFMALCDVFDLDPMAYYIRLQEPGWGQSRLIPDTPKSPYLDMDEILTRMTDAFENGYDSVHGLSYSQWVTKYNAKLSLGGAVTK